MPTSVPSRPPLTPFSSLRPLHGNQPQAGNTRDQMRTEATNYSICADGEDMSCGDKAAEAAKPNDVIREECKESRKCVDGQPYT